MRKLPIIAVFLLALTLSACSSSRLFSATQIAAPAAEPMIGLQNLNTRVVVHCYRNEHYSAEACARNFERQGYVRFRDIPYKTANFDFLKVDTYPTRRWRDQEITSRW